MSNLNDIPEVLTGPSVWQGQDMMTRHSEWLIQLSDEDIADLEQAARHYLSLGRDIGEITKEDFPLTSFVPHVAAMR